MNKALADGAFPGAQLLVARHGNVVYDKSFGVLTAGGAKVEDNTLYDLASVSKATGALPGVMKAYDLGLLTLTNPLPTIFRAWLLQARLSHLARCCFTRPVCPLQSMYMAL